MNKKKNKTEDNCRRKAEDRERKRRKRRRHKSRLANILTLTMGPDSTDYYHLLWNPETHLTAGEKVLEMAPKYRRERWRHLSPDSRPLLADTWRQRCLSRLLCGAFAVAPAPARCHVAAHSPTPRFPRARRFFLFSCLSLLSYLTVCLYVFGCRSVYRSIYLSISMR